MNVAAAFARHVLAPMLPPSLRHRVRMAAKALTRNYDAAGSSGRWPAAALMPTQPAAALAVRAVIGQRASYLVANAPVAESICNVWTTSLVGDGPSVRAGHPSEAIRRALEDGWNRFFVRCDIEGGDLVSVLTRIVRGLVTHGESFVRLLTTARGELRLQVIPAEQIDASVNRDLENGGRIVQGIEFNAAGERVAYHIREDDGRAIATAPVRVPAEDICHIYESRFAGQVRGLSWLANCATTILELDALQDAAVAKAKVTALFAGFIRDAFDGSSSALADADQTTDPATLSLEPGTLRRLPSGSDITFTPTADMAGLDTLIRHLLRSICAGAGVPYELVTGDLSQVNYSSARVGLQAFWRRCAAIRASLLVGRFLQPVWNRFATLEILSGRLYSPSFEREAESFFAVSFLWPQPAAIDPYKDAHADEISLRNGLRSRAEIIASRGRDVADVDVEIAADGFIPRTAAPRRPPLLEDAA